MSERTCVVCGEHVDSVDAVEYIDIRWDKGQAVRRILIRHRGCRQRKTA